MITIGKCMHRLGKAMLLARASLIAHETAHMWFGDLVTMQWFNDVWTKEVFANFMAAKIVNPNFPEIDHDLKGGGVHREHDSAGQYCLCEGCYANHRHRAWRGYQNNL
jgi:aminopeptidase N